MYEWYETEKYANETREIKTVWSPDSIRKRSEYLKL